MEVIASDVTFLDGRGSEGAGSSDSEAEAKPANKKAAKDNKDVVIEDVSDEPINLDDIPF